MNPLLKSYKTALQTIPFQEIGVEDFAPAFEQAFDEAYRDIGQIAGSPDAPTFENTLEALDSAGELLDRIAAILFNLNHAETNPKIQELAAQMAPRLTAFSNDITLNPVIFARIKILFDQQDELSLDPEQRMLLQKTYKNFIRSGAHLKDEDKETFRTISGRLSELSVKFGENVLAETNDYTLHITDKEDLAGLPGQVIQSAAAQSAKRKCEGWMFNLQFPSFVPFMKYSEKRELRRKMYMAYGQRGSRSNDHDNREIIREIVNHRRQLAGLLGFHNYAAYVLENRMAENEEKVYNLLDQLRNAYLPAAKNEVEELLAFAGLEGHEQLMPWDWAFYAEKLREKEYDINDEMVRPFFELQHCISRVFSLASELYGISFTKRDDIQRYHPETEAWEVKDDMDAHLAVLYMDYYPREGKKPGAWMTGYIQQHKAGKTNIRPHVSLVFNFPRPVGDTPSLLNYGELRTLLHEFGHALHAVFSQATYKSLSGTSVYRDFVELPSQIMENWAEQHEWLQMTGRHYKTGEAMDSALIEKLIASKNFLEGYAGCRQLSFGFLDMAWHSLQHDFHGDIIAFEKEIMAPLLLLPRVRETAMSPSFNHIFGGGYAAGYYGYKWAEVLEADAFSRFRKEGIFNRKTAAEFRDKILSKGSTKHPMELYTDFMGREPEIGALLERSGLRRAQSPG